MFPISLFLSPWCFFLDNFLHYLLFHSSVAYCISIIWLSRFLSVKGNVRKNSGLPRWLSDKESACLCRRPKRCRFEIWSRKIPSRRKWQLTRYSGMKNSWAEEPGRLQSIGSQRVRHDLATKQQTWGLRLQSLASLIKDFLWHCPWSHSEELHMFWWQSHFHLLCSLFK